jgi:FtsP/CotA-like multicopper oxidase with cupredoxin domain
MTVTAGESNRIRLVMRASDTHFKFMIDYYNMIVIAMDLIPIVPYTNTVLSLGIRERYDIIVNASESSGNYWIRTIPQVKCSDSDNADNIKGIFMYDLTNTEPETLAYSYTNSCDDEDISNLAPYLALDTSTDATENDFAIAIGKSDNAFKWFMAATTFVVEWADPTLLQIYTNFTTSSHVIGLDTADEWVYFIIETTQAVTYPIHLHGHDFYVLAQESIKIFFRFCHSHPYQSAQKRCRYASFSGIFGHCVPDC